VTAAAEDPLLLRVLRILPPKTRFYFVSFVFFVIFVFQKSNCALTLANRAGSTSVGVR